MAIMLDVCCVHEVTWSWSMYVLSAFGSQQGLCVSSLQDHIHIHKHGFDDMCDQVCQSYESELI